MNLFIVFNFIPVQIRFKVLVPRGRLLVSLTFLGMHKFDFYSVVVIKLSMKNSRQKTNKQGY